MNEPFAILSLSMGCSRNFSIRPIGKRRTDESNFMLSHGDLISMNGMFQSLYQHRSVHEIISLNVRFNCRSVPSMRESCGARINITFRWIMNHELPRTGCGRKHMNPQRLPYIPVREDMTSNTIGHGNSSEYIIQVQ